MLDAAFQCMKYFLSPLTCESVSQMMQNFKKKNFFYYNGVIFRHNIMSLKVHWILNLFTFWAPWPGSSSEVSGVCQITGEEQLLLKHFHCDFSQVISPFKAIKKLKVKKNSAPQLRQTLELFYFPQVSDLLRVQTVVLQFCLFHCVFCLLVDYYFKRVWEEWGRWEGGVGRAWGLRGYSV